MQGNWEAFLAGEREADVAGPLTWLGGLPFCHEIVLSGRRVRMLHASPQGVYNRVSYRHTPEQYAGMFLNTEHTGDGPAPSCGLYGDIHGTYLEGDDNETFVNVGSVGNPLDATTASYVVLEGVADSLEPAPFGIQFVRAPFDTEAWGSPRLRGRSPWPRRAGCPRRRSMPSNCGPASTAATGRPDPRARPGLS